MSMNMNIPQECVVTAPTQINQADVRPLLLELANHLGMYIVRMPHSNRVFLAPAITTVVRPKGAP
jgi:hypothetical protein